MTDTDAAGYPRRPAESERTQSLLRIAYRHLAERGFEGLRVREIAREAGVTHGTLLYHFPTKEALIQAVVGQIVSEFSVSPIPVPDDDTGAVGELRREFADIQYRVHTTPAMFAALGELAIRARRDPDIAQILQYMEAGWQGQLTRILRRGIAEGLFRADVDVDTTAMAIMAQLMAIGYRVLDAASTDRLVGQLAAQTEHWLMAGVTPPLDAKETAHDDIASASAPL